jgi:predicted enzyme related to lactoylglutathione lyase
MIRDSHKRQETVLQGKTLIAEEFGYFALLLDTEGNRIALHSQK